MFKRLVRNSVSVKRQNRAAILQTVFEAGPICRSDIAERTRLTRAAISSLTNDLIKEGVLQELGIDYSSSGSEPGRRPVLLDFDSNGGHYIIAVNLVLGKTLVGVFDLKMTPVEESSFKWYADMTPEQLFQQIMDVIGEFETLQADHVKIHGIGITSPGIIDPYTGILHTAVNLSWNGLQVRKLLAEKTGLPSVLENNVRGMALAEAWLSQHKKDLLFVHIDRGIGAGMVLGQDLYRGSRYRAGELGHMQVQLNGKECRCGGLGCLETIASLHGIYESCLEQELYEASSQPDYEGFLRWLVDMVDSKHNVVCQEIVKTSAETLGRAIANAVKLLDPGSVVLSGGLVTSCDTFFETARQSILREPLVSLQPEDIGRTELKAMAGLMGAAAVALHRFVYSDRF